jgi:prevent-host-death family protein
MTYTITLEEAQPKFAALLEQASRGDEITILQGSEPFARILPPETQPPPEQSPLGQPKRRFEFGMAKGLIGTLPDDFDEPLEDFKEYM